MKPHQENHLFLLIVFGALDMIFFTLNFYCEFQSYFHEQDEQSLVIQFLVWFSGFRGCSPRQSSYIEKGFKLSQHRVRGGF